MKSFKNYTCLPYFKVHTRTDEKFCSIGKTESRLLILKDLLIVLHISSFHYFKHLKTATFFSLSSSPPKKKLLCLSYFPANCATTAESCWFFTHSKFQHTRAMICLREVSKNPARTTNCASSQYPPLHPSNASQEFQGRLYMPPVKKERVVGGIVIVLHLLLFFFSQSLTQNCYLSTLVSEMST